MAIVNVTATTQTYVPGSTGGAKSATLIDDTIIIDLGDVGVKDSQFLADLGTGGYVVKMLNTLNSTATVQNTFGQYFGTNISTLDTSLNEMVVAGFTYTKDYWCPEVGDDSSGIVYVNHNNTKSTNGILDAISEACNMQVSLMDKDKVVAQMKDWIIPMLFHATDSVSLVELDNTENILTKGALVKQALMDLGCYDASGSIVTSVTGKKLIFKTRLVNTADTSRTAAEPGFDKVPAPTVGSSNSVVIPDTGNSTSATGTSSPSGSKMTLTAARLYWVIECP